jgi:putative SOS response-associated peptidase YedK
MCGRYTVFTDAESLELTAIIQAANSRYGAGSYKTGEIFPTDKVPVITGAGDSIAVDVLQWGWKNVLPQLLINARSETVPSKPVFREDFIARRCVVPSTGFFEWSHGKEKEKTKYLFNIPGEAMLYMAGFWRPGVGFLILTTAANDSMSEVHSRMPVIMPSSFIRSYISDFSRASALLREPAPGLIRVPSAG